MEFSIIAGWRKVLSMDLTWRGRPSGPSPCAEPPGCPAPARSHAPGGEAQGSASLAKASAGDVPRGLPATCTSVPTFQGDYRVSAEVGSFSRHHGPLPTTHRPCCLPRAHSGPTHHFLIKNLSHTHSEQIKSDQAEIALKGISTVPNFLLQVAARTSSATRDPSSRSDR